MKNLITGTVLAIVLTGIGMAKAEDGKVNQAAVDAAVASSWKNLSTELQARVDQDDAMKVCSTTHNNPSSTEADKMMVAAKAAIQYPADGQFLGDWKKGEALSLNGYGLRMGDDPKRAIGGNCYACHQMSPTEISYGTLGPSLLGYGKARDFTNDAAKEVYEKIYNPHAVLPCSNMPRFGHNKVLTIEQIKDVVAFVMSKESPVNK
jgi:sulfur-oxidizing protein SoxX